MHTLSSFFPIFPAGGSLSRSAVCEQAGANTQVRSLSLFSVSSSFHSSCYELTVSVEYFILKCIVTNCDCFYWTAS